MMKNKRKVIIALIVAVPYLSGYAACRLSNELIHRRTWDGGWNRHWVVASTPEPSINPFPFAPMHSDGEVEYSTKMENYKAEYGSIYFRRKAYGVFFFPMRCAESFIWSIVQTKE